MACQFEIVQRQFDISKESLYYIMKEIALLLKASVKETKVNTKNPQFRVRSVSLAGNKLLIAYLSKFPLYSGKYLDYLDWVKVVNMMDKGEHLSEEGRFLIKEIKLRLNENRTEFTWNHLKDLF